MSKLAYACGWLSPTGKFTKCGYSEHWRTSKDILYEDESSTLNLSYGDPEYTLEQLGYVKLSRGDAFYFPGKFKPLTKKQTKFLYEYFVDNGYRMDVYEAMCIAANYNTYSWRDDSKISE